MVTLFTHSFISWSMFWLAVGIIIANFLVFFKKSTFTTIQSIVWFTYSLSFMFLLADGSFFMRGNVSCHDHLDIASYIILYICYLVGFLSFFSLGDRFWKQNCHFLFLLLYFPLVVHMLVSSNSMMETFLYYELLLLPSVVLVNATAYTRRSLQSNVYFFIWTQLGSIISLFGVLYIQTVLGSTDYLFLKVFSIFSDLECSLLTITFFVGFGVKVPIWPFHFWLTKVHVEAPSGFSIFLSGFLVKSAVYCYYRYSLVVFDQSLMTILSSICVLGMFDGSIKMWSQTDLKKVVAYATVQEMNAIFILFNFGFSNAYVAGFIFLLAHAMLSSLMFFIVECVYKRYHSRSIYKVIGINEIYPQLTRAVWLMLVLFFGFPFTLKFFAEFFMLSVLVEFNFILAVIISFVFIFMGSVGFVRLWFSALYGNPGDVKLSVDLTSDELCVIFAVLSFSLLPVSFWFILF